MKKILNKSTAEEIADMADKGEDISKFFSNKGKIKSATHKVNIDFSKIMLNELDEVATGLNVSRQAVIKTYLRQSLDQHYLATKSHAKTG